MGAEENADYYDRKTSVKYAYFHLTSSIVLIGGIVLFFTNVSIMDELLISCCFISALSMFAYNGIYIWYIVVVKKELLEISNTGIDEGEIGMTDFNHWVISQIWTELYQELSLWIVWTNYENSSILSFKLSMK